MRTVSAAGKRVWEEASCYHPRIALSRGWLANAGTRDGRKLLFKITSPLATRDSGRRPALRNQSCTAGRICRKKKKSTPVWQMTEALGSNCAGREGSWTRQPAVPTENGWQGATWATQAASGSGSPSGRWGEAEGCSLPAARKAVPSRQEAAARLSSERQRESTAAGTGCAPGEAVQAKRRGAAG